MGPRATSPHLRAMLLRIVSSSQTAFRSRINCTHAMAALNTNPFINSAPHQSPQSASLSHQESEYHNNQDDGRTWSGDDSVQEGEESSSKKRKRPMSVSCELCKQRKVKCMTYLHASYVAARTIFANFAPDR